MRKTGNMAPRKKQPGSRWEGTVRPYLVLSEDENWEVEKIRIEYKMDKSEFLKACVMYILRNKIDPRK